MTIQQYCKTTKQAEAKQSKLYEAYDHVRLVSFPTLTEQGIYKWEVK